MKYLQTFEQRHASDLSTEFIRQHLFGNSPHSGARDVRHAISRDFDDYEWEEQDIDPNDPRLSHCYAHSKRDVKRYASRMSKEPSSVVPRITLSDQGAKFGIIDGAHRIEAARISGLDVLKAYVGKRPGLPVNEYLNNDAVQQIYAYFKTTDDEKKEELIYEYSYQYPEFIKEESIDDPAFNPEDYDGDEYEYVGELGETNPELRAQFGEWLYNRVINYKLGVLDQEYPTWLFFQYKKIIKPNTWLVHFTGRDAGRDIYRNGFTKGISDINCLGLTTLFTDAARSSAGYNFAFTLPDAKKYNPKGERYGDGETCVMLRASGVLAHHYTDNEDQVIFSGKDATDVVVLQYDDYSNWTIMGHDRLIQRDELFDLVDWVEKHFDQYRSRLARKSL